CLLQLKAAAQELRQAEVSAAFASREDAALAAASTRGGALVRGAGGSCTRFTTGFGTSFTIFFGFGFGLCGAISTTFGLGAAGSSGTGIVSGCSASSGSASVICGPGAVSEGISAGGAASTGASSLITTAGGSPADGNSRMYISQNTIAAWTRTTAAAANIQRRSHGSSSAGKTVLAAVTVLSPAACPLKAWLHLERAPEGLRMRPPCRQVQSLSSRRSARGSSFPSRRHRPPCGRRE